MLVILWHLEYLFIIVLWMLCLQLFLNELFSVLSMVNIAIVWSNYLWFNVWHFDWEPRNILQNQYKNIFLTNKPQMLKSFFYDNFIKKSHNQIIELVVKISLRWIIIIIRSVPDIWHKTLYFIHSTKKFGQIFAFNLFNIYWVNIKCLFTTSFPKNKMLKKYLKKIKN